MDTATITNDTGEAETSDNIPVIVLDDNHTGEVDDHDRLNLSQVEFSFDATSDNAVNDAINKSLNAITTTCEASLSNADHHGSAHATATGTVIAGKSTDPLATVAGDTEDLDDSTLEVIKQFCPEDITAEIPKRMLYRQTKGAKIPEDYIPPRNSATVFENEEDGCKPYIAILNNEHGDVSVVVPTTSGRVTKKEFPPDMEYAVAKCLKYETVTGEGSTLPCVDFDVCTIAPEDFLDEVKQSLDKGEKFGGKRAKKHVITMSCYCLEPDVKGTTEQDKALKKTVKCVKCKDIYHEKCLCERNRADAIKKTFKCPPCSVKTPGVFWGDNNNGKEETSCVDTCTVDNFFTGAVMFAEQHGPNEHWFGTTAAPSPNEEAIRECLQLVGDQKFCAAQLTWYTNVVVPNNFEELDKVDARNKLIEKENEELQKAGKQLKNLQPIPSYTESSLHGSTPEILYNRISEAGTFEELLNCSNPDCPPKKRAKVCFNLCDARKMNDICEKVEKCTTCKEGDLTTTLKCPDSKIPWLMHYDLEGAKREETEKFMNSEITPEQIVVDGHLYKKQMITLHNPASTGHYVSVQRFHTDWVWYDGIWTDTLKYDHKRIRKLTPDGDI